MTPPRPTDPGASDTPWWQFWRPSSGMGGAAVVIVLMVLATAAWKLAANG